MNKKNEFSAYFDKINEENKKIELTTAQEIKDIQERYPNNLFGLFLSSLYMLKFVLAVNIIILIYIFLFFKSRFNFGS